jgi:O-antigen/teichoic acid export membrane protein
LKITDIILKYWERYKKNIFLQNILLVAGGNTAAKFIGILATPIITRLYTPEDYGIYTVFMSVIGITGSIATLRYSVTIPIAKEERTADNLLKLCFLVTLSLSLLWLLIVGVFKGKISEHFQIENLQHFLWLIPIVFFGKGIYEALNNWAVRNKGFKLITRTKLSQSVSSSAIKIGFGLLNVAPLGLLLGVIAEEIAGIGNILTKLRKASPNFFKNNSFKDIKTVAIRYKDFPLIQSWSQFLLVFGAQLPVLLLGIYFDNQVVGVFGLAMSMISLPVDLIGQSVAQVYYAEIGRQGKENSVRIYNLSISLIKKLFIIGLFPVGLLIAFGPWIFKLVFGPEWYDAGLYAQLLSFMILTRFISSPISNIFNVYEKQKTQLSLNIIRVVVVLLVFCGSSHLSLSPTYTIGLYSLSMTLYYGFLSVVVLRVVKRYRID